jgi:AraC-like DNA-binding protein
MGKTESEKEAQNVSKAFLLFLEDLFLDARAGKSVYHFDGPEFADSARISMAQLDQYLVLITNQTALQHSNSRLLQSSKIILLSEVETIAAIAARFGMNHSDFTLFFKQYVGVGPDKFREQSRM